MADKIHCIRKTLRLMPQEAEMLAKKAGESGMCEADYLRLLISQKPNDYPEVREAVPGGKTQKKTIQSGMEVQGGYP